MAVHLALGNNNVGLLNIQETQRLNRRLVDVIEMHNEHIRDTNFKTGFMGTCLIIAGIVGFFVAPILLQLSYYSDVAAGLILGYSGLSGLIGVCLFLDPPKEGPVPIFSQRHGHLVAVGRDASRNL